MPLSLSDLLNPEPISPNSSPPEDDRRVSSVRDRPPSSNLTPRPTTLLTSLDDGWKFPIEPHSQKDTHTTEVVSYTGDPTNLSPVLQTPSAASAFGQSAVIQARMSVKEGSGEPQEVNEAMKLSVDMQPDVVEAPVQDSSELGNGVELETLVRQTTISKEQSSSTTEDHQDNSAIKERSHSQVKAESEADGSPGASQKPRLKAKSTTKDEGMHSDKRYLCYLCNKLFTRRRSVRDHISKIHSIKTWDPIKSLEIIVDPTTGECVEPLEKQIEKAGHVPAAVTPPPPLKPPPLRPVATLKTEPSITGSRASSTDPPEAPTPAQVAGKKRSAPALAKKGMARVKSVSTSHKKVKLSSSESAIGTTPTRSPSATPATIMKKTPTAKLAASKRSSVSVASSPAPSSRSTSEAPSEEANSADTPGTNDDGEIFCICRKGDNHTWMIACDGGCDEWFHGNCVNIRERDGDLIDKYICPNCRRDGYQTTWKRMCRRPACRKPARVLNIPPSKYCSPECGRKFFVEMVQKSDPHAVATRDGQFIVEAPREKKHRKKRSRLAKREEGKAHHQQEDGDTPMHDADHDHDHDESRSEYETDSSLDDDLLPNRGTALRAGEVKAIVTRRTDIDGWRELGRKPPNPNLPVPSKTGTDSPQKQLAIRTTLPTSLSVTYTTNESISLAHLAALLHQLRTRHNHLESRESFLDLVKTRSAGIMDDVRKADKKNKDPCGFDPRLSWTEEEFLWFSASEEGRTVLTAAAGEAKIGPPGDVQMNGTGDVDEGNDSSASEDLLPTKGGVCIKSRCVRHRNWQKAQLAEIRFEQDLVARKIEKLEREEEAIADRAVLRAWEQCAT